MLTYQDYIEAETKGGEELAEFVRRVINQHRASADYNTALIADEYDAERNTTVLAFAKKLYSGSGVEIMDETASNMKLTSNFFARLNTQRCTYSLGNGLTFQAESAKDKLGWGADKVIKDAGYYGLIHGAAFLYWAFDHLRMFKLTEFAPLWDEETGELGAGVRFWQLAQEKPLYAELYTPDGVLKYRSPRGNVSGLELMSEEKAAYRVRTRESATNRVSEANNYGVLPVVPLWGSRLRQSTLVGMRSKIDSYDVIQSGFANDTLDCAQIYWIVTGAGGSTEKELARFRQRLLYRHIAEIDGDNVQVTPYTQDIPHEARKTILDRIRTQIYEDFGGLDVHTVEAGATNDHIEAAYQPMDENADDFEYQVIEAVRKLLALQGISPEDATPQFKRNRVANQRERTETVLMAAQYLDEETVLNKLPFISEEEVEDIMKRKADEEPTRLIDADVDEDEDDREDVTENVE